MVCSSFAIRLRRVYYSGSGWNVTSSGAGMSSNAEAFAGSVLHNVWKVKLMAGAILARKCRNEDSMGRCQAVEASTVQLQFWTPKSVVSTTENGGRRVVSSAGRIVAMDNERHKNCFLLLCSWCCYLLSDCGRGECRLHKEVRNSFCTSMLVRSAGKGTFQRRWES